MVIVPTLLDCSLFHQSCQAGLYVLMKWGVAQYGMFKNVGILGLLRSEEKVRKLFKETDKKLIYALILYPGKVADPVSL